MKTKTVLHLLPLIAAFTFVLSGSLSAAALTPLDTWSFTYSNGTQLNIALSDTGKSLGSSSTIASVESNQLKFFSDVDGTPPETASTFRTLNYSPVFSSGLLALSWDYTSASFTNTAGVSGTANVGFGFRKTSATSGDVGLRLRFDGSNLLLQFQDSVFPNWSSLLTISGNQLSQNLSVRLEANLDNAGNAGSFQAFYKLGSAPEVTALSTGSLPAGFAVEALRTAQQTTNGGTNWRAGDTVFVDNLVVSIPEPTTFLLLGAGVGMFVLFRRRRH